MGIKAGLVTKIQDLHKETSGVEVTKVHNVKKQIQMKSTKK
jgi:hypothetical protein